DDVAVVQPGDERGDAPGRGARGAQLHQVDGVAEADDDRHPVGGGLAAADLAARLLVAAEGAGDDAVQRRVGAAERHRPGVAVVLALAQGDVAADRGHGHQCASDAAGGRAGRAPARSRAGPPKLSQVAVTVDECATASASRSWTSPARWSTSASPPRRTGGTACSSGTTSSAPPTSRCPCPTPGSCSARWPPAPSGSASAPPSP